MKAIQTLTKHIGDELKDARVYAKLALEYKESDPEMAALFYKLSGEEMGHMDALHKSVTQHIEAYKREHGDAPEGMKALYDYVHKREIEDAEKVIMLQGMFRK